MLNCIVVFALVISKSIEFSLKGEFSQSKLESDQYLDFTSIENAYSANNVIAILACLFIPFRFYTLLSHFNFFTPFASLLNVLYRITPGLTTFSALLLVLVLSWNLGFYFFFSAFCFDFKSYVSSLISLIFYNFWESADYAYMVRYSPHSFIFIGTVVVVVIARFTAFVLVVFMGVFMYK